MLRRSLNRSPIGGSRLLTLLVGLSLGCSGFMHGYTTRQYEGQVLRADAGPGARRLALEKAYDPAVRNWVDQNGVPAYILVKSAKELVLVYFDPPRSIFFKRSGMNTTSTLSIQNSISGEISQFFTPADQKRLRSELALERTQAASAPSRTVVPSEESCYALGVRHGRCATAAILSRTCAADDHVARPERCKNAADFDRGVEAGARQVILGSP